MSSITSCATLVCWLFVCILGLGWLVVNLVMAVAGGLLTLGGAVAWEAHLVGFVVGVLLIGPFARWAGPPAEREA